MNKDVISITPEDDITDVIAQIKASEKKIVAIIPPQPAGILRSVVNIKLIAKVSEESEKVPVLVTSDPVIVKLAHEIRIPVAEDLQSRPHIPTEEDLEKISSSTPAQSEIAEDFVAPIKSSDEEEEPEESEPKTKEAKKSDKKAKKEKKPSKLAQKFPWLKGKEKIVIIVPILIILIIGFLVWALVFNASAEVYVKVLTNNENNFSEQVSFIEESSSVNAASGIFQIKKTSHDFRQRQNFTATGKKDLGDKATGEVDLSLFFDVSEDESSVKIISGTKFYLGDLEYVSVKDIIMDFDAETTECENGDSMKTLRRDGCKISKSIPISAVEPGEKYNQENVREDWKTDLKAPTALMAEMPYSISNSEIGGGSSKIVTIVSQADVDKVKENLSLISESDGKNELFDSIPDSDLILEETLEIGEPNFEVTPAVGEEVKEGVVPVVVVTKPFSVYTAETKQIEEFIKEKVNIPEDQKIYSFGDPFIEYFTKTETGYSGKIKTVYKTGPNITEDILFDKIAGRKVGDAQGQIRSISGIDTNSIKVDASILVNTIPTDRNKVKITVDFEE